MPDFLFLNKNRKLWLHASAVQLQTIQTFFDSMASSYFSHLTSPEDSDIDAIISEATDLCVLEQIAALNIAHLSSADLPAEIESRFRKLKTFPGANQPSKLSPHCSVQTKESVSSARFQADPSSPIQPDELAVAEPEILLTGSPSPGLGEGIGSSSPSAPRRSPSPRRAICCFGCSPKKMVQRKKMKTGDEIYMGFGAEKMKEQRKKLQKVLREQDKASREAERMVEIMEEAAARLNAEAFDEILGGDGLERFK